MEPDCEGNGWGGIGVGDGDVAGGFEEVHGGAVVVSEFVGVEAEIGVCGEKGEEVFSDYTFLVRVWVGEGVWRGAGKGCFDELTLSCGGSHGWRLGIPENGFSLGS